jgi:UDP-N-acetylglucosamine--N-acetylmuramyl-(pentapeptide) pyrophosphoryl-undecaprenol N-acetylglucosamine transferase
MNEKLSDPELKVVIASGGTGGHLFPGIAVAEELRATLGAKVSFIITDKPITIEILEGYGFLYRIIGSRALKGKRIWGSIATLAWYLPKSIWQARKILQQEKPDMVIGMGSYSSGPVGVAAHMLGIPLAIHEQNAILGLTNRLLAKWADLVFLSFPDSNGQVDPEKIVWSGNPIRPEFFNQEFASRPASPFTILVMGGSQGAHQINMQMLEALPFLHDQRERLKIIHLAGAADEEAVRQGYDGQGFRAEVLAFTKEVARYLSQAHLVICRAGASTLAELTAMGRVGILVPYPYAANQHQEKNARCLSEVQAAYLILNQELSGERIAGMIQTLMAEPQKLIDMECKSRSLAHQQAAALIVAGCRNLLSKGIHHQKPLAPLRGEG